MVDEDYEARDSARVIELIRRLINQTRSGAVSWGSGRNGDQVMWSSRTATVILASVDNDQQFPFSVQIANASGATVASRRFNATDEGGVEVAELYRLAARRALRVDETFSELFSELEEPPF